MFIQHYPSNRDPEEDWHAIRRQLRSALRTLALIIAAFICIFLLFSCKSVEYVPVHTHSADTVYQSRLQRDSIYLHDSIYYAVQTRGDTVVEYQERWHTAYRDRLLHDTAYIAKHDTVPMPYAVIEKVEVERKLGWLKLTLMWTGGLVMSIGLLMIGYYVWRFVRDLRKLM